MTVAEPNPADARREALELDPLASHVEPVMQVAILRQQLAHALVGAVDVFRIAGEGSPPEGPEPAAKEAAHVGRDEAGESKGLLQALVVRHLAQVVAVVEHRYAEFLKC